MLRKLIVRILTVCTVLCAGITGANGQESYLDVDQILSQPLSLAPGTSTTLDMGLIRQVDHVEIDAIGIGGEGMFEVIVNGLVKGTIHVPGHDPKYIVTIADETRTFTLRHISGNKANISSFKVFFESSHGGSHLPANHQDAANVSRKIIRKMSDLQPKVTASEFQTYLLPIKIAAGHSYAIATASGDLSKRLADSLIILQTQFHSAKAFFDSCLSNDQLFDLSVESLELMYSLDEMID